MTDLKAKWAFRLAVFGSVLSVTSLLFTGYQWWNGQSQARINAAVELTRTYLVDPQIPRYYALVIDQPPEYTLATREDYLRARSYLDSLGYIALGLMA